MNEEERQRIATQHAQEVQQFREFLEHRMQTLERDNRELRDELDLATELCDRLSSLLSDVAVALKGPEALRRRHSFHDLPELALAMKTELDQLKAAK